MCNLRGLQFNLPLKICKESSMLTLFFLVLITKQVDNTLAKLNIYI